MTRETKLALILGFAVVMVVGVLVTDHLSLASQAELAGVDPEARLADASAPVYRTLTREELAEQERMRSFPQVPTAPVGGATDVVSGGTGGVDRSEGRLDGFGRAVRNGIDRIVADPPKAAAKTDGLDEQKKPEEGAGRSDELVMGEPVGGGADDERGAEGAVHVVRSGESLWGLADRYYGDGALHGVIASANPGALGPNGDLLLGARLVIPERGELRRGGGADPAPKKAPEKTAPEKPRSSGGTYTVVRGDTLGEIASKQLGTVKRMGEILALNADKIDDADDIRVGMVLKMPAK